MPALGLRDDGMGQPNVGTRVMNEPVPTGRGQEVRHKLAREDPAI